MDIVLLYGGNDKNYRIVKSDDDVSFCIELVFDELHNKYLTLKNGPREIKTRDTAKSIIHDLSSYLKRFNRDIEGFHMVENILLRTSDKRDNGQYDLYSHRISILFPNWPARFQQVSFRQKVEAWIRDNGPIHIAFDILWLNYEQMKQFEYMYKHWYEVRINEGANVNDLNIVVGSFISEPMHYADVRYKEGLGRYEYTEWIPAMVDTSAIPNRRDLAKANIPYVVLANAFSISMAELSAEAIKMLPTGRMIGERTFGAHGQSVSYSTIFHDGEFGNINGNHYVFTSSMQTRFVGEQRVLEGEGVSPTKTITQAEAGYEGAMEKAIDYIKAY